MPDESALAIIVVNYGSSALLELNLVATSRALPDAAVYVVDNRTTAEEARRVGELAEREGWIALPQGGNLGFGGGVNRGVEAALADGRTRFLLLNPDASIGAEATHLLLDEVDVAESVVAAPLVDDGAGRVWSAGHVLDLRDGATHGRTWAERHPDADTRRWLTGAALMINDAAWTSVDGFDEEYFLYWEDVDFSLRIEDAGGRLVLVEQAKAIHDEGGTQGIGDPDVHAKSPLYYYYNIRNRMLLAQKLLDAETVRRWDAGSASAAREVLLRGGRRQLLRPWRPLSAVWRGWRDGRRIARQAS
ncbi:N-acetylglucosaminyl-diphospho-decaprenol L-rhamnosyltransferase [Microbacterium oxydans]|uniref:N-acetylglucosaminyl-diphospho-decaprenol L-rhamnosyltransferase n=1 Tax=Microbacterium oxydans TaxID=82380 RepID=A0A0F0LA20_9MICO|nr:glycosyltransferase family 2 protein [Microbacterium oxydans]KJL29524.1 N-acetylglucosaminyl-diphospho-decaprenol L-rhamnosyltransferase [Microbacterium oxydans]CAH0223751.1 N-acetylglucosaminyl-diphospho-decaprenol L-rhamnosyltransferase [Microbacterium oxydans]